MTAWNAPVLFQVVFRGVASAAFVAEIGLFHLSVGDFCVFYKIHVFFEGHVAEVAGIGLFSRVGLAGSYEATLLAEFLVAVCFAFSVRIIGNARYRRDKVISDKMALNG